MTTRRPTPRRSPLAGQAGSGRPAATWRAARPARAGDPYGLGASSALIAPGLSILGLLVVAWVSLSLLTGNVPFLAAAGKPGASGAVIPNKTPTPSNVVNPVSPPPEDKLLGSIVYEKAGNLWVQDANGTKQITTSGQDSMPSFSPDGQWILYIESVSDHKKYQLNNRPSAWYTLTYPVLYRIHPDGSSRQKLGDGLFSSSRGTWFYWMRQPVLSPNGRTVALFSDGPDPAQSDVILQFFDLKTRRLTRSLAPESPPLGHQDAAWSPDGKTLLYVKNGRDGARGAPRIYRYTMATKKISALTGPGYESPRYSPDGRYVVATKASALGTDVVILDARNGSQILSVTNDSDSWGAVWSPAGDAIAYLHIEGGVTDLRVVKLNGTAGRWTLGTPAALTDNAGLDGASHPGWFIPVDQLPAPIATPAGSSKPAGSPSPSTP